MFLPSLLEYTKANFQQRLIDLIEHSSEACDILNSESIVPHIDIISAQFAKNINVSPSILYDDAFNIFSKVAKNFDFVTIHLMLKKEELLKDKSKIIKLLKNIPIQGIVYLPEEVFMEYQMESMAISNFKFGIWYDLNSWPKESFKVEDCLLMTVKAGSSSQNENINMKERAYKISKDNQHIDFLLDGGWKTDEKLQGSNLNLVSYSSFWKEFKIQIEK